MVLLNYYCIYILQRSILSSRVRPFCKTLHMPRHSKIIYVDRYRLQWCSLVGYANPRAPATTLPQLDLQNLVQNNVIGYHFSTQAIALVRDRVSFFLVLRLNSEKELLADSLSLPDLPPLAGCCGSPCPSPV